MAKRTRIAVMLLAVLVGACGTAPAPPSTSARGLPLGDVIVQRGAQVLLRLTVEIAATAAAQQKGLMGVSHLAGDQGEAFVFGSTTSAGFWMKDTQIPLDIAFVDAGRRVVDVQNMVPCTADPCTVYYAAAPYRTAVETAAGVLTRAGVRAGDGLLLAWRGVAVSGAG